MTVSYVARIFRACLLAIVSLGAYGQSETTPAPNAPSNESARSVKGAPSPGRVWIKDLEGTWITRKFTAALKATRSPRLAAQQSPPIVIQLKKDNNVYPILTTNFRSAVLQFMIEIEPDKKPQSWRLVTAKTEGPVSSSEVMYSFFTGKRDKAGHFVSLILKEPHFAKGQATQFVLLSEPLEAFINRSTVSGKYKDERGRSYEFTETGEALLPDRKFSYEVLLDTAQTNCDVITNHHEKQPDSKERIGFAWKGDKLQLFNVSSPSKGKLRCDAQPFVSLVKGEST
jgi:hypothetical protein